MKAVAGAVVVLVAGGALGSLGGWLWWQWWSPAPKGQVFRLQSGDTIWIPEPSADQGFAQVSGSTPEFVVLAVLLGLLLGVLAGIVGGRRALLGLVAVLVGSGIGLWAMLTVGAALSPPDRDTLAATVNVGSTASAGMDDPGWPLYLLWPLGALAGFVAAQFVLSLVEVGRSPSTAVAPAPPPQPSAAPGPPG